MIVILLILSFPMLALAALCLILHFKELKAIKYKKERELNYNKNN